MATRGRNICNTLKAIRKQIADANGISYSPEECHFKGECKGTCPKCEHNVSNSCKTFEYFTYASFTEAFKSIVFA